MEWQQLLAITNLPTLERRRLELKLCHLFKIIHNLVYFPNNVFIYRERSQYHIHSTHNVTVIVVITMIIISLFNGVTLKFLF